MSTDGFVFMSREAVRIEPDGWRVVADPPVRFVRSSSMRALPMPIPGGNVDLLWELVNIPEPDRNLYLANTLECYRPDTP
jgi:hypothetical protein